MKWIRVLALLIPCGAAWAQSASVLPAIAPQAQAMPAPTWCKPGVRLIYWKGDMSQGIGYSRVKKTADGKKVNEVKPQNIAGMGYTEFIILAVEEERVVVETRSFLLVDGQAGLPPMLYSLSGAVDTAGVFRDLWINPLAFPAIFKLHGKNGWTVGRVNQPFKGKQVVAVAIGYRNDPPAVGNAKAEGVTINLVLDERSGVLLSKNWRSKQANIQASDTWQLKEHRLVTFPWAGQPMPAWVRTVKRMEWEGRMVANYGGMASTSIPLASRLDIESVGANYAICKQTMVNGTRSHLDGGGQVNGMPVLPSSTMTVKGATPGSFWLPPEGLRNLPAGQVLVKPDKFTRVTCSVGDQVQVGRRRGVTIVESNAKYKFESVYDLEDGKLLVARLHNNTLGTVSEYRLAMMR